MELQKNDLLFLNFLKTRVNRNIAINEEEILNDFAKTQSFIPNLENNRRLFKNIYLLDYLKGFINDSEVNEIMVHDHLSLQIEKGGQLKNLILEDINEDIYFTSLETLALKNKITWNYSNPFASFYAQFDQSSFRASLIHESCGPQRKSKFFLRRIRTTPFPLLNFGINNNVELDLNSLILEKKNILLAGAAGSGKSSLLASLLNNIEETEHVIILEDTHEIITSNKFFTHFLGQENLPNKSLRELCTFSLRLRPDRIILGEIRSSEIIPFVLAMNTGHKGMMSTIHADSAIEAVSRMALLFVIHGNNQAFSYEMSLKLICKNIDVVIYLKDKKIKEIIKIIGADNGMATYDYIFRNNLS